MHFKVISAILFAASASALEYSRPAQSYADGTAAVKTTPVVKATDFVTKPAAIKKTSPKKGAPKKAGSNPTTPSVFANGMIVNNGSPSDTFQISDIILTPAVPVAGKPLDVHLIGKLKKVIDLGSKTTIKANYDGAEIMNIGLDVCELAKDRKFKHQCPAQPEDFDVHHTLKIPASSPKGNYVINAYGFNQDNVRIFNVSIIHNSPQGYSRY
ncbi:Phosphatidylglycerol/phosphatidylinositol transfer protein [Entomophthora muscae]|uniref:Phosphatidylglycerol/phosphatidylinositol transfer protein n=1 Tax=Entomophthora muscae TaxID=34485 RepID=A0ACC2TKV5_9FUNG|nr:Phosphatidylglycerol/phosphatidylinositol transfer protein [Entomophthora muscae]